MWAVMRRTKRKKGYSLNPWRIHPILKPFQSHPRLAAPLPPVNSLQWHGRKEQSWWTAGAIANGSQSSQLSISDTPLVVWNQPCGSIYTAEISKTFTLSLLSCPKVTAKHLWAYHWKALSHSVTPVQQNWLPSPLTILLLSAPSLSLPLPPNKLKKKELEEKQTQEPSQGPYHAFLTAQEIISSTIFTFPIQVQMTS